MDIDRFKMLPPVQFITHKAAGISLSESAEKALKAGVRWIQFRCKEELPEAELWQMAQQVQQACKEYGALFVIDDRVELAAGLKANGVHLGKHDMPIEQARRRLGKDFLIGGTANTLQDMLHLARQGANYIGLGPFRFTSTKEKLSPLLGLEGYKRLMTQARRQGLGIPVYAIGGINSQDAADLQACGVDGIAVSSALLNAHEPQAEAAALAKPFTR